MGEILLRVIRENMADALITMKICHLEISGLCCVLILGCVILLYERISFWFLFSSSFYYYYFMSVFHHFLYISARLVKIVYIPVVFFFFIFFCTTFVIFLILQNRFPEINKNKVDVFDLIGFFVLFIWLNLKKIGYV